MTIDKETLELRTSPGRARAEQREARRRRLVVVLPDAGPVVSLSEAPLELGREALSDASVSRRHVALSWSGGVHHVADLGSKNGTWIDGVALGAEPVPLADQSVIRAGGVVMVYESVGEDAEGESDAVPGRSAAALALRGAITRAAADPSPALVLGETGSGKESVARELHRQSRRVGSFVAVNVAELSERLVESQLFGHVKGAFTGADQAQPGLFRAADRGTLLLDEIGELPLELQAKLLRAIQEREVRPVGATKSVSVDVRVVAATHADLAERVQAGTFRRDLWARLRLWEVRVPSLAARRADRLAWVRRLAARWRAERKLPTAELRFDAEAVERLLLADFPENLRGLERLVHQLGDADDVDVDVLEPLLEERPSPAPSVAAPVGKAAAAPPPATAEQLLAAFAEHGSVRALARHYGKDKRQIYRWIDAFGLRDAIAQARDPEP